MAISWAATAVLGECPDFHNAFWVPLHAHRLRTSSARREAAPGRSPT